MTNTINSTLKIRIDRKYVAKDEMEIIKDQVDEFKYMVTKNDLLRFFKEQTDGLYDRVCGEIIKCDIKAIGGYKPGKGIIASYCVDMILDNYVRMWRVHFYIEQDGEVNLNPLLYDVQEYKMIQ